MARKRMIDPGIWKSEQVCGLTASQFQLYIFLISSSDDEGRLRVAEEVWRREINLFHPWTAARMAKELEAIYNAGLVLAYVVDGETYLFHPNWRRYQWLNRPTASRLPVPPADLAQNTHRVVTEHSQPIELNRRNRIEGRSRRAAKSAAGSSPEDTSPDSEHRYSGAGASDGAAPNPSCARERKS